MNEPASASVTASPAPARLTDAAEWVLTIGLAVTLAWTTLCLGGYLAETMVHVAPAVWGLAALGLVIMGLRPRPLDWRVLLPVPFLLFALGSVLWLAPARWLAWREWLLWFQMWLWFALALHLCRSRSQTWVLLGTLAALGLAGVAMAAYQRFVDPKWLMLGRTQVDNFLQRSAGMFGIPNSLAALLELLLPVFLVALGSRSVRLGTKIVCAWCAALYLLALVLTGSRGGWIGAAAALALWPVFTSRNPLRGLLGGAAVIAAMAAGLALLYQFSEFARVRIDPFLAGQYESSRPIIWRVGLRIWQEAPWLGTGAASYNVIFDQYRPRGFLNEPDWTHNDYLNTLSDYGVVGFALWIGAGAALLLSGWRAIQAARRLPSGAVPWFESWRGRLGLWLGWLAFSVHLFVDFHTKIPALAYGSALTLGILLRDSTARVPNPARLRGIVACAAGLLGLAVCWRISDPVYRSEALRFDSRRKIDAIAAGRATIDAVVPPAILKFQEAVKVLPENGRAWGDLSYAIALSWHVTHGNSTAIGQRAEAAALRALELCPITAEFWTHQGVALDMQGRTREAGESFRRALALAPHNPEWHYHYAHHLSALPDRKAEARAAAETCLALDPSNRQAEALLTRLTGAR